MNIFKSLFISSTPVISLMAGVWVMRLEEGVRPYLWNYSLSVISQGLGVWLLGVIAALIIFRQELIEKMKEIKEMKEDK